MATLLTAGSAAADPGTAPQKDRPVPVIVTGPGAEPSAKPGADREAQVRPETCSAPNTSGATSCLRPMAAPQLARILGEDSRARAAAVAAPKWCEDARDRTHGTRTAVCRTSGLTYSTYRTVNGQRRETGQTSLIVISYSYGDAGLPAWGHQVETSVYRGWGDALKGSIKGTATKDGACKVAESKFPSRKLAPVGSWKLGESYFDTTVTRRGAKGKCATTWNLTFTSAGYPPAGAKTGFNDFRCDNATAGTTRVGCVVPWYASPLIYSKSRAPELASHVKRAQASGLPGGSFKHPLHRTTDAARQDKNRNLACPRNEPRPPGKTCDEYPVATSREGLASGGQRRSFSGCSIAGVPSRTGPKGASACMIKRQDQDYQGGKNSSFYRDERMLDGDPFRVLIGT
ncbi:hypothetical protein [Streptomyces sp. NPDC018031]|uniref:NucA/NucB deoxyribonuclease domain-containing protein n=1 Tax=Streptomyces sp. NPDC018031 TaxID=3365033 RepID=UPI00379B8F90